jgi:hypothetical protein
MFVGVGVQGFPPKYTPPNSQMGNRICEPHPLCFEYFIQKVKRSKSLSCNGCKKAIICNDPIK